MDWSQDLFTNWPVRLVCVLLILAAYIDGKQLRVPNWLTFSMVLSGLVYSGLTGGWAGLGDGLLGRSDTVRPVSGHRLRQPAVRQFRLKRAQHDRHAVHRDGHAGVVPFRLVPHAG